MPSAIRIKPLDNDDDDNDDVVVVFTKETKMISSYYHRTNSNMDETIKITNDEYQLFDKITTKKQRRRRQRRRQRQPSILHLGLSISLLTIISSILPDYHHYHPIIIITPPVVTSFSPIILQRRQKQKRTATISSLWYYHHNDDNNNHQVSFPRVVITPWSRKNNKGRSYYPMNKNQPSSSSPIICHVSSPDNNRFMEVLTTMSTTTVHDDDDDDETTDSSSAPSVWIARLILLTVAALYGTNYTVVKELDEALPVGLLTSLRFCLASAVTLPWLLTPLADSSSITTTTTTTIARKDQQQDMTTTIDNDDDAKRHRMALITLAGMEVGAWNAVGYIAQAVGLTAVDASKSAFICSLGVVIVALLDTFIYRKNLPPRSIIGILAAVGGVALLESGGGGLLSLSWEDTISFLQPLTFGIGFWRMERALRCYNDEARRLTAGALLATALVCLFYSTVIPSIFHLFSSSYHDISSSSNTLLTTTTTLLPPPLPPLPDVMSQFTSHPTIFLQLLWTGWITTAFTSYVENIALQTLSAAEATLIYATEPLWGAIIAAVVLGERFGVMAGVGGLMIVGGCLVANGDFGVDDSGGGSGDD